MSHLAIRGVNEDQLPQWLFALAINPQFWDRYVLYYMYIRMWVCGENRTHITFESTPNSSIREKSHCEKCRTLQIGFVRDKRRILSGFNYFRLDFKMHSGVCWSFRIMEFSVLCNLHLKVQDVKFQLRTKRWNLKIKVNVRSPIVL